MNTMEEDSSSHISDELSFKLADASIDADAGVLPFPKENSQLVELIGNLSTESTIGTGGFGVVYKGSMKDSFVAVKRFRQSDYFCKEKKLHNGTFGEFYKGGFTKHSCRTDGYMPRTKFTYRFVKHITANFSEERKIGTGIFGEVYKGYMVGDDQAVVAVKILRDMHWLDEQSFQVEFGHLMMSKHPNLVQLIAMGYGSGVVEIAEPHKGETIPIVNTHRSLIFEFLPNGNLADFLSEQYLTGLNWEVRFKIIKGICQGLQYIHELDIMHLDLKPENILLDANMSPKVGDFGILNLLDQENTNIMMTAGGTHGYLPPEFLTKKSISKEYDIFSLGAIIKRIVIGLMDYSAVSEMDNRECIEQVHNNWRKMLQGIRRYPSLEVHCKQVRICIEIAVDCMQTDPRKRPSMDNIIRKLDGVDSIENDPGSQIKKNGTSDVKVRRMSFKELQDMTNKFTDQAGQNGIDGVYKGRLEDGEVIAVRRLHQNSINQEQQFQTVVKLMSLEHKNILRLRAYCYETTKVLVPLEDIEFFFRWHNVTECLLCYEVLPNGSLDLVLNDRYHVLDWQTRHTIIRGICEGLHYLHVGCQDAPIVHDDFKPTNILLDDGMVPKIGDFCTTMTDASRGYVAPEFMDNGKITVKSNIYSLGVIILEIVTGDKCLNGESSSQSYNKNVLKSGSHDTYILSKYPSLEAGFIQQVRSWIRIGLKCMEIQSKRRPTIGQIMHFLQTESANPEYYDYGQFSHSTENNITSWPYSEIGDHTNELGTLESILNDASVEPIKLSYPLLTSVTRNFSRVIGRGGFGTVYLGVLPKGKVAVKKLSILQDLSNKAFVDEITCLKKAQNINIVRLLGYCAVAHGELVEVNGTHVIAEETHRLLCFEYVPNGNLQDYIQEKCRGDEWHIRYNIIKGICNGLHYLHKQRISHLDLKSENVLLDANKEPKITDFGLSRFLAEGKSIMVTKQIFGTLGSIAPELINSGEISFKSDVYGLGIIITKLLMRGNNYDSENWHKSLKVGCSQEKRCVEIAKRCVEYSKDKRPTVDEIIHELNEIDNMIQ